MDYTDMKTTFSKSLIDLVEQGANISVVDADLMRIVGSTEFKKAYPDRYVNCGIAEMNAVDTACGLALMGSTVFVSSFGIFMALRAADQVRNCICYNDLDVKVCGIYSGITGEINGGTHIPVEDVAIFRALPNMRIVEPGDANEFYQMMQVAAKTYGPFYIRIPKGPMNVVLPQDYKFELGKGLVLNEGTDATLVTSGITTEFGIKATTLLKEKGLNIRHIHMPSIKPIDDELIIKAAKETGTIFVAENHSIIGGLGSAIAETLAEKCPTKVIRIGVPDVFSVGAKVDYLSKAYGFDSEGLANTISRSLL